MSRSRRHTPISAVTCCESNKPFKQQEHRRERSMVKMMLHMGYEDWQLPGHKMYGNEWASPRDGKQYFGDMLSPRYASQWSLLPGLRTLFTREEVLNRYKKGMRK